MIVTGVLKQEVEIDLPIEIGLPTQHEFETTQSSVELVLAKDFKPKVTIWVKTPSGFSLEAMPVKIISGTETDTLIVSNFDSNEGYILLN